VAVPHEIPVRLHLETVTVTADSHSATPPTSVLGQERGP
jgi:hypothetical protein